VVQTLLYSLNDSMPVEKAMAQARIHQQWNPNVLFVEAAMPIEIQQLLKQKGHDIKIWPSMGASQAIQLREGKLVPVAEQRVILQNAKKN
jgi:gamma-glutamyltranspeptidase/glutathione hydrolase